MANDLEITASLNKEKVDERGRIIYEQDNLIREFRSLYGEGNYQAIKTRYEQALQSAIRVNNQLNAQEVDPY